MAGVQIDGVNNKIDFDDDADTSISSSTDDTLLIESGGVNIASITAGEFAINEGSADIDFRVESNGNANAFLVDGGNDKIVVDVSLDLNDSKKLRLGTGNDTEIYFDGTDTVIDHTPGSGGMYLRADAMLLQTSESTPFTMLRYDSGGNVKIFTEASNLHSLDVNNDNANPEGIEMRFSAASPDNTTAVFFECNDTTTTRLKINADGDVLNHDNAYGSISDERIKEDIRDANSQWQDIKNIKVRNYKKKDDIEQYGDDAWEQIGVIAQELEASGMNKLVNDEVLNEDGSVKEYKSVKYSVLYMKAIKALQEAMAKIETLETKVKALEDA